MIILLLYDIHITKVESAKVMFKRSIRKYGLRYTGILSDGDSSMFTGLTRAKIYGETLIIKQECINHVSKRMARALKALLKSSKKTGVNVRFGGKGHGKLTAYVVEKLSHYFSSAVSNYL